MGEIQGSNDITTLHVTVALSGLLMQSKVTTVLTS